MRQYYYRYFKEILLQNIKYLYKSLYYRETNNYAHCFNIVLIICYLSFKRSNFYYQTSIVIRNLCFKIVNKILSF